MKHYYITDNTQPKGFIEVSEAEFVALIGTEETRPYANKVYRGAISIDEVPEDLREAVQAVVDAKIARWGAYESRDIPDSEALDIITGGDGE